MVHPCIERWLKCLVSAKLVCPCLMATGTIGNQSLGPSLTLQAQADEPSSTVKEVTAYILTGYEQHTVVAECQELVSSIVRCLSCWATVNTTATAAILDTFHGLSFSTRGQQALVKFGACDVLISILPQHIEAELEAGQRPSKRQRPEGGVSQLLRVVQLLTTLLLESPNRPAPGTLEAANATAAFSTLQQVMHGPVLPRLCTDDQMAVAAVTSRLAMEPAVYQVLLQLNHPLQQHTVDSSTKRQAGGLDSLLGVQQTAEHFLLSYWETGPYCCSVNGSAEEQQGSKRQMQLSASFSSTSSGHCQQQSGSCTAAGTSGAVDAVGLMAALTEEALFEQLLPAAQHCPIMNVAESDPVQYLCDVYQRKQLLQPLQCNHDIRLIQATAASSAALLPLVAVAEPGSAKVGTTTETITEKVLVLAAPVTAAEVQSAVSRGFSLVLRDMPKRSRAVAALVDGLEQQLGLPAGANLYYTPAGSQGLKVHYDDHCVFVLQLSGQKIWTIAPPQHCQLPLTYTPRLPVSLPASMQSHEGCADPGFTAQNQGHPCALHNMLLQPGNCLYIPRGWVHQAVTHSAVPQTDAAVATAADTPQQAAAAPVQQVDASMTPEQLSVGVHDMSHYDNTQTRQLQRTAAEGSLHLSIGLEVEAWFSVQGFLHCLIQTCCMQCMTQCVEGTFQVHSQGIPIGQEADSAELMTGEPAEGHTAAAAIPVQQTLCLAYAAAALLAHHLLVQHARQFSAFRRACPLLVRDSMCRQAVERAFVQQLTVDHKSQQHSHQKQQKAMCPPMEWSEWALQHVLQGATSDTSAAQGFVSLQMALQHVDAITPQNDVSINGQLSSQEPCQLASSSGPAGTANTANTGSSIQQTQQERHQLQNKPHSNNLFALKAGARPEKAELSTAGICSDQRSRGHMSQLLDTLDWIDRVETTAGVAAKGMAPHLHGYVRPQCISHTEGLAGGLVCLPRVSPSSCAAGHSWDCWSLAEQVLSVYKTASPGAPGKSREELNQVGGPVPAVAAAAAEVLPMAWSHLLAALDCGQCRQATGLSYCDEATRCVEGRQLVRYAHLCLQP